MTNLVFIRAIVTRAREKIKLLRRFIEVTWVYILASLNCFIQKLLSYAVDGFPPIKLLSVGGGPPKITLLQPRGQRN